MNIKTSKSILIVPITIITFLILVVVAIYIVRESIANWRLQNLLQKRGVDAVAVVTQLDEPKKGSSTIEYQFVVTTPQGNSEDYIGYAEIPGVDIDRFQPGTRIMIVYDPENPERSLLEDPPPNYSFATTLPIVIAALIGVIAFIGAGIRLLLITRQRSSP